MTQTPSDSLRHFPSILRWSASHNALHLPAVSRSHYDTWGVICVRWRLTWLTLCVFWLAVHVPPAALSVPAGVQQQSWWEFVLQTSLQPAGPDAGPHHDPACVVRVLFQRTPWGVDASSHTRLLTCAKGSLEKTDLLKIFNILVHQAKLISCVSLWASLLEDKLVLIATPFLVKFYINFRFSCSPSKPKNTPKTFQF